MKSRSEIAINLPPARPSVIGECPVCSAKKAEVFAPTMACSACIDRALSLPNGPARDIARVAVYRGTAEDLVAAFALAETERLAWLPPDFHGSVPEKLPDPAKAAPAIAWMPTTEKPILVIRGVTGRGKSRILAILALDYFRRTGRSPDIFWAGELGAWLAHAWRTGDADRFTANAKKTPFLLFDDLDKTKITERVAEFLFAVTDARIRDRLPTVITTNLTGDEWEKLLPAEYGPPLLRRWRERGTHVAP